MSRPAITIPFAVACLGIATFTMMDTTMKRLAIEMGAYAAILWRQGMAAVMAGIFYFRERQPRPGPAAMRFHVMRGCAGAIMAMTWFYGLARLPMAEAIALSFIAPIIALFLARLLLGETVGRESVIASLLGLAGVVVMLVARLGDGTDRHLDGVAAILFSAVLYAWNLILMRQQAQIARAIEVAFFQNAVSGGWLLIALPFVWFAAPASVTMPHGDLWLLVVAGAALTVISLFLLSWAYARAEAQALVPVEYTAFVWLALWGAVFYNEAVTPTTFIGAALIVTGCLIAARGRKAELVKVELAG